jgi:Ulp1 family protease
LVYETATKCFYHYDTLKGANYWYVKPLVKELLQQIHQTNNPDLKQYLVKRHDLKQGNGWDCGIAVIALIKRISEKYQGDMENIELRQREELRKEYLEENGTKLQKKKKKTSI